MVGITPRRFLPVTGHLTRQRLSGICCSDIFPCPPLNFLNHIVACLLDDLHITDQSLSVLPLTFEPSHWGSVSESNKFCISQAQKLGTVAYLPHIHHGPRLRYLNHRQKLSRNRIPFDQCLASDVQAIGLSIHTNCPHVARRNSGHPI
jgi:hypothetical protein